jgi:hypothetical protein
MFTLRNTLLTVVVLYGASAVACLRLWLADDIVLLMLAAVPFLYYMIVKVR